MLGSGDLVLYTINDSYYINQAIDSWLCDEQPDPAAQDTEPNDYRERYLPND